MAGEGLFAIHGVLKPEELEDEDGDEALGSRGEALSEDGTGRWRCTPEDPDESASSEPLRDDDEPALGIGRARLFSPSVRAVWTHFGCGLFFSFRQPLVKCVRGMCEMSYLAYDALQLSDPLLESVLLV